MLVPQLAPDITPLEYIVKAVLSASTPTETGPIAIAALSWADEFGITSM